MKGFRKPTKAEIIERSDSKPLKDCRCITETNKGYEKYN